MTAPVGLRVPLATNFVRSVRNDSTPWPVRWVWWRLAGCAEGGSCDPQYEQDTANGVKLTIVGSQVSENTVSIRIELRGTAMPAAGVDRIVGTDTIEVRGNNIAALRFMPDLNDPQTVKFREWTRTQSQPSKP